MKSSLKTRLGAGAAVLAAATATLVSPLFTATPAFAAGTAQIPGASLNPLTGQSGTTFNVSLPSGAACPGDSTNSGYRWQTYMVPSAVDPSTLQFGSTGPTGTGNHPLFDTTGAPVVNQQTANQTTSGGPGVIQNIPAMNYAVYTPGQIPAGVYNIGIACTLGGASTTQESSFWNVQITVTTNAVATAGSDPAAFTWTKGARPLAPTLNTLTPGNGTLTAAFTPVTSDPATSGFTVTATPSGGGAATTATGTGSPITVAGLTNGTAYTVTVHATNSIGSSPESNALSATVNPPANPPVTNFVGTPGPQQVALSWVAPATGGTPANYTLAISPTAPTAAGTFPATLAGTSTSYTVTNLTAGTSYTFTLTPTYAAPYTGTAASTTVVPQSNAVVLQDVTATRPVGALVLTQVCGVHGALAAETSQLGFGTGLAAVPAVTTGGTAPFTDNGSGVATTTPDPQFGNYPYPKNADGTPNPTYPTHCALALGNAQFVATGPGAGQFFAASGVLNQVTVVDTRDVDAGWTVSGRMSQFSAASGTKTFSGSQLGWTPVVTSTTPAYTDSIGNQYTQVSTKGANVAPNTPNATGLSTGGSLGTAPARAGTAPNFTGGLGTAVLDARVKLLIPVTAQSGTYTGTLTLSAF
ncbi:MAG: hypothetical protein NVS3B21_15610 [Acidimicrobiales bacterium]